MNLLPALLVHLALLWGLVVRAQTTQTILDAAGNSVVVVVSTGPAGAPITQTLSTLQPAGQTTATTAPTQAVPPQAPPATTGPAPTTQTTTTPVVAAPPPATTDRGPVGQPDPTTNTPGGATPFIYTTVINGVTTEVSDNFTPTNPKTTPFKPTGTGTVWDYSQYLLSFGPQTTATNARNAGDRMRIPDCLVLISSLLAIRCVVSL